MLISHTRPPMVITTNGTFVDDSSVLINGRPGETARLTTPGSGATTLSASFSASIVPRLFGLLNTSFPPGSTVVLTIGASTYTQTIASLPRGERVCWIMLPSGLASISSCGVSIASGVSGGSTQDIGEFWIGEGDEIPIIEDYGSKPNDSTTIQASYDKQPFAQRGTIWRTLRFTPTPNVERTSRFQKLWTRSEFDALLAKLDRGQSGVYVPTYADLSGEFSQDILTREAVFGLLTQIPENKHLSRRFYGPAEIQVTESPIPV